MNPQQAPSYAASPLGAFPELSQMYATNFSSPLSNAQASSQAQQDQTTVANQKAAEAQARANAAAFSDKSKYTIQQRSDGGFGFYGPDGKEVSAAQYANNTGQKLTDVLKDSQNPIDQRYIADHNDLTAYLQAKAKSNVDPAQKAIADNFQKQVQKKLGINLSQVNPGDAINALQYNYPTIYGANKGNAPGFSGSSLAFPVISKNSTTPAPTYNVGYPGAAPRGGQSNHFSVPQGY